MKLTKTPAHHQHHDYNLKLTKAELLSIYRVATCLDGEGDFRTWCEMLDLIEAEGKKLDNPPRE